MSGCHLVSALSLLLCLMPAAAQEKMHLVHHWEPGKIYHFETHTDAESIIIQPGDPEFYTSDIMQMDVSVTREPGSDRKLVRVKFVSFQTISNLNGSLTLNDSKNPKASEGPLSKSRQSFVGKAYTLVYDKDDNYMDALAGPDMPDDKSQSPTDAGANLSEIWRRCLPGKELTVGDSFEVDVRGSPSVRKLGIDKPRQGRVDSLLMHDGRNHVKIVMHNVAPAQDPTGILPETPVQKETTETLFDLARHSLTRTTTTHETSPVIAAKIPGQKTTTTLTLKSIEDTGEVKSK